MDDRRVHVGQRFETVGVWRRTWEVEAVYLAANNIAHAKLRDIRDHETKCTLSPSALLDAHRFRRLEAHAAHQQ